MLPGNLIGPSSSPIGIKWMPSKAAELKNGNSRTAGSSFRSVRNPLSFQSASLMRPYGPLSPTALMIAARVRAVIGSGTVSNAGEDGGAGKPISEGGLGYSCIAEIRMIEKIATGAFVTPFMKPGDTVRIEMMDETGHSIFGAIEQVVEAV